MSKKDYKYEKTLNPTSVPSRFDLYKEGNVLTIDKDGYVVQAEPQGGGGEGTKDYTKLENKPQINGVSLVGNKTATDLSLPSKSDVDKKADLQTLLDFERFVEQGFDVTNLGTSLIDNKEHLRFNYTHEDNTWSLTDKSATTLKFNGKKVLVDGDTPSVDSPASYVDGTTTQMKIGSLNDDILKFNYNEDNLVLNVDTTNAETFNFDSIMLRTTGSITGSLLAVKNGDSYSEIGVSGDDLTVTSVGGTIKVNGKSVVLNDNTEDIKAPSITLDKVDDNATIGFRNSELQIVTNKKGVVFNTGGVGVIIDGTALTNVLTEDNTHLGFTADDSSDEVNIESGYTGINFKDLSVKVNRIIINVANQNPIQLQLNAQGGLEITTGGKGLYVDGKKVLTE